MRISDWSSDVCSSDLDVHTLHFIRRARDLGFPIEEIGQLLALWQDRDRTSADVKALAMARVEELKRKEAEIRAMRLSLEDLARHCHGDERPDCTILRSEQRRVGKECVRKFRSRWW